MNDLLEHIGQDIRSSSFSERQDRLAPLLAELPEKTAVRPMPEITFETWEQLAQHRETARSQQAVGINLKRKASVYGTNPENQDHWHWPAKAMTISAVMIYAQALQGRTANLDDAYTFGVWDDDTLVPIAKAGSGLSDAEHKEIAAWVKQNTLQRFGPVREVTPHHIFEIAFEGLEASARHKSGIILHAPRISEWQKDRSASQAGTLRDLQAMLSEPRPKDQEV